MIYKPHYEKINTTKKVKLPKKFFELSEDKRLAYAMKAKKRYEDKADLWASICRKLATKGVDFTPAEIELIDLLLNKDAQ